MFQVAAGWIYYIDSNSGDLYKIRINGTNKTKLDDDTLDIVKLNVYKDTIFLCLRI